MGDFISGAYSATYNGKDVGIVEEGFRLSHELFKQIVTGDQDGQTPIEGIYQGRAQFITFTCQEANKAAVPDLAEPYADRDGSSNVIPGTLGRIGQQDVGNDTCPGAAKPLILIAIPGLCAASRGPASITFPLAILAENFPVDVLYGPTLKQIPLRLRVYPETFDDNGTERKRFFTQT